MAPQRGDIARGALFTDQYQLTMAQLYFEQGWADRSAQFDYFFRSYPDYGRHQAGYCVFAGLGPLLEWMEATRFTSADIDALRSQTAAGGDPLFGAGFLEWLEAAGNFSHIDVEAVPEGRVVHPNAPIAVVRGPLALTQILETPFLNHLNYPTLIATKASRVAEAGRGRPSLDFGLRRGPAWGANAGSRAALVGGCDFTSNVGVSSQLGLPPKGTHAHSMVQAFIALGHGELEAFRAFATMYPDDCVLLVDTIDTLSSGVPNAIEVFRELRDLGHRPVGIRLDSGDLAYLAIQSAIQLDAAGFEETSIVLSSNLDELAIWQIISQIEAEAPRYGIEPAALIDRLSYGVGTRLITSHGDPSLDGVFKLVALEDGGSWTPSIKVSNTPAKIGVPGAKRVWRVYDGRGVATADVLATGDEVIEAGRRITLHHPHDEGVSRTLEAEDVSSVEPLLVPVYRQGSRVGDDEAIDVLRDRRLRDLDLLDPGVRRLVNPHIYHVSLSDRMKELQRTLLGRVRRG